MEENTGNQKLKTRWRLKNERNWKVNIIKENRSKCLPYNNKKKVVQQRLLKMLTALGVGLIVLKILMKKIE